MPLCNVKRLDVIQLKRDFALIALERHCQLFAKDPNTIHHVDNDILACLDHAMQTPVEISLESPRTSVPRKYPKRN